MKLSLVHDLFIENLFASDSESDFEGFIVERTEHFNRIHAVICKLPVVLWVEIFRLKHFKYLLTAVMVISVVNLGLRA